MIAVIIPCYRVREHILGVLDGLGDDVAAVYVVDDACPEGTGRYVEAHCRDPRVRVLYHKTNLGVGGAVVTGYRAALADGADILVKIDGDGQMDPSELPKLVAPIRVGEADYAKGNRFYSLAHLGGMPLIRVIGNAALSFITKLSSGYWSIFDPTNGYTALHASVARLLPLDRLARRYFFESDMLFQLGLVGAVVCDVPMEARYGQARSGVRLMSALVRFSGRHVLNTLRRIFYNYFLRDFSPASVELVCGLALLLFGVLFGATQWAEWAARGVNASAGTVMLSALPVIVGVQLLLAFLNYDIVRAPRTPLHPQLLRRRPQRATVPAD